MMIDRANRLIASFDAFTAEANAFFDDFILFVRSRDDLGGQPLPSLRQTHIVGRSGLDINWRRALELAKADLANEKAPPANDGPSAAPEFHLEAGITDNISVRQAAQQLKARRHG